MKQFCKSVLLSLFLGASLCGLIAAQSGGHTLFGDLKVDESQVSGIKPISFDIILYTERGSIVGRQTISNNGRYRFMNLPNGNYDVAVEVEAREVARIRVFVSSAFKNDFRQDLALEWRPAPGGTAKAATISAGDYYARTPLNQKRFERAREATNHKRYDDAIVLLRELLDSDSKDFQAWTELGTIYLFKSNQPEAEKAYFRALAENPSFVLALMNLGRLRITTKNYEAAIAPLTQAVKVKPTSAEANYYLGEAYLQIKKGSKAVGYFYEALKLEPIKMAEAHLRLAALYHGAGMKDKAAAEYEQFLKKKPGYPDRKKLEQYIAQNKKPD